ncbi:unnamed protein product [Musa banksii]
MATAVAGDTVAREGAVADEPLPAVSGGQEATGVLRLHVQLVVLVEALTHEPVTCGRGVPQPVFGAGKAGELPRDLGVDGAHRPRPGHRGRGQDEQEEGEAESHARHKCRCRFKNGERLEKASAGLVPSLPTEEVDEMNEEREREGELG